jgi:TrmH family RNA methyltransferase
MALSKNRIKYIHSLERKKKRKEDQVFVAEGPKLVSDLLGVFPCRFLAATREWLLTFPGVGADEVVEVTNEELSGASLLKTPQQVLAIFEQPEYTIDTEAIQTSLCLALDDVQDPGNLGTIVRLADWFGIEQVFCSHNTADIYNPKAIQATMGAIARVKVHYVSLAQIISSLPDCPVYGTFLDGKNIYRESLSSHGLIVMGNEGNGISRDIAGLINRKLYIPHYPGDRQTSESLNVAIATAITCAEFRRQTMAGSK